MNLKTIKILAKVFRVAVHLCVIAASVYVGYKLGAHKITSDIKTPLLVMLIFSSYTFIVLADAVENMASRDPQPGELREKTDWMYIFYFFGYRGK